MENTNKLLSQVNEILQTLDTKERENGEKFNYFSVLKIERAEIKHSAFIAELLNPKGLHGQGDIFLKLFIDLIKYKDFNTIDVKVEIEKDLGKKINDEMKEEKIGRTDIFITNKTNCIVIENKIGAGEQPEQLVRYHGYCEDNYTNKFKLLYLTPEGEFAKNKNLKEEKYFCISYRKDIIGWLEKCLQKCEDKPILFQSINQYINIIKKITNQINSNAMKEIHGIIRKDFEAAKTISEQYDNVLAAVSNELRDDVIKRLKTAYPKVEIEKQNAFTWASSIFIDFKEKIGIESFNTKGKFGKNSLFIGKFIYEEPNWKWKNPKPIFENDVLWDKIKEYGKNENREIIVEEIFAAIKKYIEDNF